VSRSLPEAELVRLYRETIRPLYAYVSRRVGGDASLAEDLVQDTWMRALDSWPANGVPDEPLAWLVRVARNTLVSHFRRLRPEYVDPASIDVEDDRFSPDAPDTAAIVGWGLARLRRVHADVLEDFYFEGQSVSEIAAARSLSERAVEGRLRRARAKLKKKLERIMSIPEADLLLEQERQREAQKRFSVGMADGVDVDAARVRVLEVESAFETFRRKLDIRQKFLAGSVDAIETELRVIEAETEQRTKILTPRLELARKEIDRVAGRVDVGTATRVELSVATLRRLQLEMDLTQADLDLTLVRRQIAQHRAGR
jgi:RNA polymerase sigma factor (sigma-70 family)